MLCFLSWTWSDCFINLFAVSSLGFRRPRLSDSYARSTGSEKTIFTVWIPPWNWKVRAQLQISNPPPLISDRWWCIILIRTIRFCIVELFILLHSLEDAVPRLHFRNGTSIPPDVASDSSVNFLFTPVLQASRETPWLRTTVSLHHPVWSWGHGGKTSSHGDRFWGPYHPHPFHSWGCRPAHDPYCTGQSKSHCGGQKGGPCSFASTLPN